MRHLVLAATALASLSIAAPTWAQPSLTPSQPHAAPMPPATIEVDRWYGGSILLADGAAATLVLAGVGFSLNDDRNDDELVPWVLAAGVGTYGVGGPAIHLSKGRPGAAVASAGLRIGGPFLLHQVDDDGGAALGILGAMVIDWTLLSRHQAEEPVYGGPSLALTPTEGGGIAGLTGTF